MPISPPALDDRSFPDLVNELVARIPAHTPEWTNPIIGDPGRTLIDLFAWMGDALLYRINLIPERQRLAFLALLGEQMRPAVAAQGLITLAPADPAATSAVELAPYATVSGPVNFETLSEITVLPLTGSCYAKRMLSSDDQQKLSDTIAGLNKLYKINAAVSPYQTTPVFDQNQSVPEGYDVYNNTVDHSLWIALLAGPQADVALVRKSLGSGGQQVYLNVGFVPAMQIPPLTTDISSTRPPIRHSWRASLATPANSDPSYVTLHESGDRDTTAGLNTMGVTRLPLPAGSTLGVPENDVNADYKAGVGARPPRIDDPKVASRIVTWICLTLQDAVSISWLGANAVQIDQLQTSTSKLIGVSDGSANQSFFLGQTSVDPSTFKLQVDTEGIGYVDWNQVDDLGTAGPNDQVFELDSEAGTVSFGDGIRGFVPPATRRIRVARMRAGGGAAGNLPAQSLVAISATDTVTRKPASLQVSQPVATTGGADTESLADAERRIPAMLRHRDRVVTTDDYQTIAASTPGASIGRVEVLPLFHPQTLANNIPGTVSVMVLPQNSTMAPPNPRPDRALLQTVFAYLEPRKPLATELYVIGCQYIGIGLSVGIAVRSGYGPDAVASQVTAALKNALWPLSPGGFTQTGYPLGRTVRALELQVVAGSVAGVDEVTGVNLFLYANGVYSRIVKPSPNQAELAMLGYQLPELLRVVVITVDEGQTVTPPDALGPETGPQPAGTPIPLVPEVC